MWPTPYSTPIPIGALYTPTNQQVYSKTPLFPTNQQVNRCILRPLLSLGYKSKQDQKSGSALPDYQEIHPTALAASLLSINSSLFCFPLTMLENSYSDPRAQTMTEHEEI